MAAPVISIVVPTINDDRARICPVESKVPILILFPRRVELPVTSNVVPTVIDALAENTPVESKVPPTTVLPVHVEVVETVNVVNAPVFLVIFPTGVLFIDPPVSV